jgi:hypothetical protein
MATLLIDWLNGSASEGKVRIARLIDLVSQIESEILPELLTGPPVKTGNASRKKQHARSDDLRTSLDELLSYYHLSPQIYICKGSGGVGRPDRIEMAGGWRPAPGSKFERRHRPDDGIGEAAALMFLLELIRYGHFSKLSRCRCGAFFFKRFSHQRFHKVQCRVEEFQAAGGREARNAWARDNYWKHLHANVK